LLLKILIVNIMFAVLYKNKNPLQEAFAALCKGFQYGDTFYTPLQMRCVRVGCIYAMRCDAMRKIRAILFSHLTYFQLFTVQR